MTPPLKNPVYATGIIIVSLKILTVQVSNFVFTKKVYNRIAMERDLITLDLMRGRDVGLQPYNQVRSLCGLPLAKDFEDLADLIHIKVK